jgi:DNA-binding MarR family transcriptional regulator
LAKANASDDEAEVGTVVGDEPLLGVGFTALTLEQWRRERPDLDLAGFLIGVQIGRLGLLYNRISEKNAATYGVGAGEMRVLTALRRQGAPYELRPTDLFRMLGVTSGTMTYRIDKLVERGLVVRAPDPRDGRGAVVRLTAAGLQRADLIVTSATKNWRARMGPLADDPDKLAKLEAMLAEIATQLEKQTSE